jgi:hypothetical protein
MESTSSPLILRNVINEIKNACPEVIYTFIFQENQILAQDQNTTLQAITQTQAAFAPLASKSDTIGGLKSVTFQGTRRRLNITFINDFYLATVTPNQTDQKIINNLTRVTIPAMLKIAQENPPTSNPENLQENDIPTPEPIPPIQISSSPEIQTPQIQFLSVTVENMGVYGRFGNPDVIHLDPIIMAQWNEQYGYNKIKEIIVEDSATGKSRKLRIFPIKEQKFEGKGIIQMPEKTQQELHAPRGTALTIRPVVENFGTTVIHEQEASGASTETAKVSVTRPVAGIPVSQFMVENLNGRINEFLGADVARVDSAIIARWNELFNGNKIQEITVEDTVTGKKLNCRFKPIKDSNLEGKGVIQLSDKLQSVLLIKKGALVLVKPIIEQ